jgi:secreted trypsin-like serine protease
VDEQLLLLREYACHRRFVEIIAESEDHPDAQAARQLLLSTIQVAEGKNEDQKTYRQCALVWNKNLKGFGSGIYLGGRIVLTASHVATAIRPTTVSIGVSNIDERLAGKDFAVAYSIARPEYDATEWDVAILVLKTAGPQMPAVKLGTTEDFNAAGAIGGSGVTVCGFGWGWPAGFPKLLSNGVKRSIHVGLNERPASSMAVPEHFFVTGDASENPPFHNICKYDSGAPAFIGDSVDMTVLGIASATVDIDGQTVAGCGNNPFGVFARIDVGRDWISEVMAQHAP